MNLLLITNKKIIKQIFNLVAAKLDIELTISDINVAHKKFDLIIIEDNCLDDKFTTASYAKSLGIITKDKDLYETKCDFLLTKPFLPSQLVSILEGQIKSLEQAVCIPSPKENEEVEDESLVDTIDFIETLADDISDEINEESDESILPTAFVETGGILDSNELSKIQDILTDTAAIKTDETISLNDTQDDEDDWIDLSDIIDKAIDEVREYQFNKGTPIKLKLNEYSMAELSPLFNHLDQGIIDALTSGEEITIQLKVDK